MFFKIKNKDGVLSSRTPDYVFFQEEVFVNVQEIETMSFSEIEEAREVKIERANQKTNSLEKSDYETINILPGSKLIYLEFDNGNSLTILIYGEQIKEFFAIKSIIEKQEIQL